VQSSVLGFCDLDGGWWRLLWTMRGIRGAPAEAVVMDSRSTAVQGKILAVSTIIAALLILQRAAGGARRTCASARSPRRHRALL
jgi:hypothetical protein